MSYPDEIVKNCADYYHLSSSSSDSSSDSSSENDDELDMNFPFMSALGLGSQLGLNNDLEKILLDSYILEATLGFFAELSKLTEALENVTTSFAHNRSRLFTAPKSPTNDMPKDISDEEMANSAFGQSSNTARNFR